MISKQSSHQTTNETISLKKLFSFFLIIQIQSINFGICKEQTEKLFQQINNYILRWYYIVVLVSLSDPLKINFIVHDLEKLTICYYEQLSGKRSFIKTRNFLS